MKDVQLIKVNGRYHVRIKGEWHKFRSWEEVRILLVYNGFDPYEGLADAVVVGKPLDVEFKRDGRHKWLVNGKPQPATVIRSLLKEAGCGKEEVETILRVSRLCADVDTIVGRIRQECQHIEEECKQWLLSKKSGSDPSADTVAQ
jgi:hypothetical protein